VELNPDFSKYINCKVNDNGLEDIKLAPGETYEVAFPLKVKKSFNL